MGILDKIEDKLSGNKSSTTDSSHHQSSSTNPSHIQHPVTSSTAGPTGTAVPGTTPHSASTTGATSGVGRDGYGTTGHDSSDRSYAPGTTDRERYSNEPTGRYGNEQSGYSSSTNKSEMPGIYSSSDNYRDNDPRTTTTTNTTSSSSGPRQPFDPYSSKGQRTAADAAHQHGMSPSTSSNRGPYEDANVSRSQHGGVLNSTTGGTTSGNQQSGGVLNSASGSHGYSSGYVDSAPHASSAPGHQQQDSSSASGGHHYGRDAGIVGGTGAAGVGAYELGKHQQGSSSQNYSRPQESNLPYRGSEEQRSGEDSSRGGLMGGHTGSSHESGGSHNEGYRAGYKDGYKDGMEHVRRETEERRT